jgi:DNA polymerase III epsilon subunit-like protein
MQVEILEPRVMDEIAAAAKILESLVDIVNVEIEVVLPEIVLIFDVETTGLIPKQNASSSTPVENPYITQLSYIKYNTKKNEIIETFDAYVKIPENIVISELITSLTGINREMCDAGMPIQEVLSSFYNACKHAECIIAHNLEFDREMIKIEFNRNIAAIISIIPDYMERAIFQEKNKYCTMRNSIDLCNIIRETPKGRKYKKFPKLIELYQVLFSGKSVDNLHNSFVDTLVCLRCYLKLRHNIDICDVMFESWLVSK